MPHGDVGSRDGSYSLSGSFFVCIYIFIFKGGNSGIGFETVKGLLRRGCEVWILCRDIEKAQKCIKECGIANVQCNYFSVNLCDLASVTTCANEIRKVLKSRKIDIFICNAGIMGVPYSLSPQGYEMHFATNYLGHFALVGSLFDTLKGKIVVLSSDLSMFASGASPNFKYSDDGLMAYCNANLCCQSFGLQLRDRYRDLEVYVVHPGVVNTPLLTQAKGVAGAVEGLLRRNIMLTLERGSQTTLRCVTDDRIPSGVYYHNVYGPCKPHPLADNVQWASDLWDLSVKLCQEAGVALHY